MTIQTDNVRLVLDAIDEYGSDIDDIYAKHWLKPALCSNVSNDLNLPREFVMLVINAAFLADSL